MDSSPLFPQTPEHTCSYKNLEITIQKASNSETQQYNSLATRTRIQRIFCKHFGSSAHKWQVDLTEAILLGLDSFVIAGTGAGKTMPFMMPLFLDPKSKCIIISPIKVLQEDQVSFVSLYKICIDQLGQLF